MTDRDFHQQQRELEKALSKLKRAKDDPEVRRDLLLEMRRLLAEADRFVVVSTPDLLTAE